MVVLDTNIIIDHLRQQREDSSLSKIARKYSKEDLALSIISIQELYEGKSTKIEDREQALLATVAPLKVLSYTYEIAQLAGEIARDLKNPIDLADAAIAATSIINNAALFTLNPKDFRDIDNLVLENLLN